MISDFFRVSSGLSRSNDSNVILKPLHISFSFICRLRTYLKKRSEYISTYLITLPIATTYNPFTAPFKEGLKFAEGDTSGKKWDDLNPFQKMSIGIQSKAEGIMNTPAKGLDLDVNSPMQDLMTMLKHERLDDTLGNFITGLSTGAGLKDQGNQDITSGGMGGSPSEGSLGKPLALEEDPVLNLPTENYNNFSF